MGKRFETNADRMRRERVEDLPRMKNPTYDLADLRSAIQRGAVSTKYEGWAPTTFVAKSLGVSRTTAYKWLCDAAARGLIRSELHYSWVYTRSVMSRHWAPAAPHPGDSDG